MLKSQDFFERTAEILKLVLGFLGLPEWWPETSDSPEKHRNKGG